MEKQRTASKSKFCRRLLILTALILFAQNAWSEKLAAEVIQSLTIIPTAGQNFYANQDIKFELFIPNVDPSKVDYQTPADTKTVTYKKIHRIASETNIFGTAIQIWVEFLQDGSYSLPPLKVKVQNKRYEIPFENIVISLDPQKQRPVMLIQFGNGKIITSQDDSSQEPILSVRAGEKVVFTTQMKYVLQLITEKYDLPVDSIFTRTKVFEPAEGPYHEKDTIGTVFPVSQYSWTPLAEGLVQFPTVKINVISYTGIKTEVRLPVFYVKVLPAEKSDSEKKDDFFEQAFMEQNQVIIEEPVTTTGISQEDCEKLAELRSKEKRSLFGTAKKNRRAFEKSLGLPATQNEFRTPFFYIIFVITLTLVIILIISLLKKKILYSIVSGAFLLISAVGFVYAHNQWSNSFAISKGCTIQSIPEVKVESKSELPAGSRIEIKEKSSGWIYIELGETCGWCHEDEVIIIK